MPDIIKAIDAMKPRDRGIPDLISAVEAGEILGISRQAVLLRATAGQLLGAKVGSTWVFRRVVVERSAATND